MQSQKMLIGALLALSVLSLSACRGPLSQEGRGEELYVYCAQCHGDAGEGKPEFRVPAIAGLPDWYVEAQLNKFRTGARGDHPDDLDGLRMRPMARTLANPDEVRLVSQHVGRLEIADAEGTLDGDAQRGRALYEPCIACHGARAEGNPTLNAPPLTAVHDWYLVAQLKKFKDGIRGADALDTTGLQMRPFASALADEQAMHDVVAYISSLE